MFSKFICRATLLVSVVSCSIVAASSSVYDIIKDEHLATLPIVQQEPIAELKLDALQKYLQDALERVNKIDLRTKREGYHKMMQLCMTQSAALDNTTIRDLNLITGPAASRSMHLTHMLDRCITESGRLALMSRLMRPTDNIDLLSVRQDAIMAMIEILATEESTPLFEQHLIAIATQENKMLALHRADPLAVLFMQQQQNQERKDGKVTVLGEAWRASQYYAETLSLVSAAVFNAGVAVVSAGTAIGAGWKAFKEDSAKNAKVATGLALYSGLLGYNVHLLYKILCDRRAVFVAMQERTKALYEYVQTLQHIKALVEEKPVLAGAFESLHCLDTVLDGKDDANYQRLLDLVSSPDLVAAPSLAANPMNLTLVLELLEKYSQRFFQGMLVIGELDLLNMSARIILGSTLEHPWTLPRYIADAQKPQFTVTDVWNPFITKAPVLNSLSVGGDLQSTVLISGPNAGGKSTIMKGCILSVLLAQTLTIVPAANMELTPFEGIITYLNIVDDIVAGNSFFKAGVIRAHEVLQVVEAVRQQGGFCLVGLDEVFNGTAVEEGEAAAMALVETIGEEPHTLCLSVTHFKQVTHLEDIQPDLFKNYRVSVDFNVQGDIVYRFMLEEGIADQQIAFKILEEEGFGNQFLARAKRNLAAIKAA